LGSIVTSCMNAVRNLPQGSAVDIPWGWMEQHQLTESSVVHPEFDLKNEIKITQTAARFFFAIILPKLARPFGYANLGLGTTHLVWCVVNIKKIRNNQDGCGPQDIENALIRLFTGVYDLAIAYILYSPMLNSIYVKTVILLAVSLVPAYPIRLHHLIFEKATNKIEAAGQKGTEKKFKFEIDHRALKVGCLIKQFCNGLVETFFPAPAEVPKGISGRLLALPYALGTWGKISYRNLRGIPKEDGKPK
jgi:hypothetical protein